MKNLNYLKCLIVGVILLVGTSAWSKENITKDHESAENLSQTDNKEVKEKINEVLSKFAKISGYVQTGYVWGDENAGDKSTFQLKRMRLFVNKKLSKTFEFKSQFECFSGSIDGTPYKKKVITVMDAFINAKISDKLTFRGGQFYLPLGFENYAISPATLETVDFSNICYRMVCRNAITNPNLIDYGRDIGIMAYGDLFKNNEKDFNYFSYQLSLTNGSLPTLTDNNKSKDIVARFIIRPIKNLRIMGAYNWGEYTGLKNDNSEKYLPMNRYFAGAWYKDPKGLSLRAEYAHIESDEANVDEDAFYVLAAYKCGQFQPVLRWDMYRDNINKTTANNRDAFLAGISYELNKNFKFQFNYTHSVFTDKVEEAGTKNDAGNSIQVMCLMKF